MYAGHAGFQDNTTAGSPTTSANELLETRCCCLSLGGSFNAVDTCCRTRFGRQAALPGIHSCHHHLGMVRRLIVWSRGNHRKLSHRRLPFRSSRAPFSAYCGGRTRASRSFLVVGLSISLLQSTIAAANERLRRSREQIELAAESAKIGFTESLEGGKVIWTPEMERLFGLEASAFEGTIGDWLKRIHPEDRIRFDDERRNQIAQRIPEVSYEDPASGRPDPLVRGPEAADYGTRWFDETCKR